MKSHLRQIFSRRKKLNKKQTYGVEAILFRLLEATGSRSISLFVPKIAKRSCLILLYSLV